VNSGGLLKARMNCEYIIAGALLPVAFGTHHFKNSENVWVLIASGVILALISAAALRDANQISKKLKIPTDPLSTYH
jgi:hypothetical protein